MKIWQMLKQFINRVLHGWQGNRDKVDQFRENQE